MAFRRHRSTALAALAALLSGLLAALLTLVPGTAAGAAPAAPDPFQVPVAGATTARLNAWAQAALAADRTRRQQPTETVAPLAAAARAAIKDTLAGLGGALRVEQPADAASTSTLVLYDTAGPFGFLGELYAMATANLAGHFGTVTTMPVQDYTAGQADQHTATIYIGSTYYGGDVPDAIPDAFYTDVATTARPVVWINDNIWNLANKIGVATFTARYGWDPTNSFFGPVGSVTQVDYKTQPLTRTVPPAGDGGILRPLITSPAAVTPLATASDTSTSPATRFPWALRSANLTYIGEVPYAYVNETDRIIAWHDLLFDALAPGTAERHRAILRLEDISPDSDPNQLMSVARYLNDRHIPYAFQVIPVYTDPNGEYNNGVPQTIRLAQRPQVLNALKYMLSHGGRIVSHGYTHQFGTLDNPYSGVTGDDFEFYLAHVDAADNVILDGPVPGDSSAWATARLTSAKLAFPMSGLPVPQIWTTPHYAASAADYGAIRSQFAARLERSLYFSGQLSGGPIDHGRLIGQFFPYPVRDVYGAAVLPENLGNYEPEPFNNHPARLPADLIRAARYNLAVRDGFASFFYHPYYPLAPLSEIVDGVRGLGYTFVDPASVIP